MNNIRFLSNDGIEIKVRFVDLFNIQSSLEAIIAEMKESI